MKTKHTKGEWKFEQTNRVDSNLDKFIKSENDYPIAWCYDTDNAKLIAAAPELLEALLTVKDYIDYPHTHKGTTRIRKAVESAIKKATS